MEAHTAAVESELEEGRWAVDCHHGAESGDIQTKILCQEKEEWVPWGITQPGLPGMVWSLLPTTACHPGLWTWQRPGWGTARRDPGVTPSWSKAGGCWDTDPSCSLPESYCPLLPRRLTMGSEDRLSAESIPLRAASGTTPLP